MPLIFLRSYTHSRYNLPMEPKKERIAKVLARAGLCSRRDAERWIASGRVAVNGETLESPAFTVGPEDEIVVDGQPLPKAEKTRLFMFHKPEGLVTTAKDERGRPTVFDGLPPELGRLISIGRLDMNTEGLLLLTNDGELARWLELPSTGWTRRYRVRVYGQVPANAVERLRKGMTVEGVRYGGIEAVIDKAEGSNSWLTLSLSEGKNREIRKVMEALGLKVNRLIRVSYGPFQLGKLPRAALEEVSPRVMREQLASFFKEKKA
jgi:23S rRNA pseudouridine2605 synthase